MDIGSNFVERIMEWFSAKDFRFMKKNEKRHITHLDEFSYFFKTLQFSFSIGDRYNHHISNLLTK